MRVICSLCILVVLFSCNTYDENEIRFSSDAKFELKENEKIIHLDQEIVDTYFSYFDSDNIQIPLFRHIQGEDYNIYIGIPFEIKFEKILEFYKNRINEDYKFSTDNRSFIFSEQKKQEEYVTHYIYNKNELLLFFVYTSKDELVVKEHFRQDQIEARIKVEKW